MQGRVQFYIVVYNQASATFDPRVVDRVLIDLELNISSNFTERRTYNGLSGFSQFDMSFKIERKCSKNYYGPLCDIFCSEEGVFTCDSEGNRVCTNSSFDIKNNCSGIDNNTQPTPSKWTTHRAM